MINLILFGPPGSGKGTQAKKLAERFNLLHISTGDLFRYELGNNTPLGQEARKYMERGELVPDEITIGMLRNKLEAHPEVAGYIFDGFPRTIPQAEALDELLASKGQEVTALIALDVPDEEIIRRILLRGRESGRADDQSEEVVRNRINTYREQTVPVYEYYAASDKSRTINGMGEIEEIAERLAGEIAALT
ncbi:MAG TPA: adenylate kinase [Phaeodactylibacter sp.]|nr:adenylate kinase [Phaeodactylibacter sp.]